MFRRLHIIPLAEVLIVTVLVIGIVGGQKFGSRAMDCIGMWLDPPANNLTNPTIIDFWGLAGNGIDWSYEGSKDPIPSPPVYPLELMVVYEEYKKELDKQKEK